MLTVCRLPYRNVEHWKMSTYIFGYLLPTTFAKDYTFWFNCQTLGHAPLPKLVNTGPPGVQYRGRYQFNSIQVITQLCNVTRNEIQSMVR